VRTGIILAGGRSARFGGDKLAAEVDGLSVLASTMAAFASVVDGLIVAGSQLPADWRRAWDDRAPVICIPDPGDEPHPGPLAALANVVRDAAPDPGGLSIVVGGDMPALVPGVLRLLLDRLEAAPAVEALVLERPGPNRPHPTRRAVLPVAVRDAAAQSAAIDAEAAGERSLQGLLDRLAWAELPAADWLPLDPEAMTLLDVDTADDLDRIRARLAH
jgi:molybdopterin-guanine dinucleotide biosynthesis protein A